MKDNIKEKINQYYLRTLPSSRNDLLEQTVHKARLKMNRYECVESTSSFMEFFVSQLLFIRKKVWIIQFSLMLLFIFFIMQREDAINAVGSVSTLVPLLFLSWSKELSRSLTYGTAELEISTRFSLRQVLLSRIVIMGFIDVFLLTFCACYLTFNFSLGVSQAIMYLLVPFLFTAMGCLFILNHFPTKKSNLYCGIWCGAIMVSFYYFSHWESRLFTRALLFGWYFAFFVSVVFIAIELHHLLRNCSRNRFLVNY